MYLSDYEVDCALKYDVLSCSAMDSGSKPVLPCKTLATFCSLYIALVHSAICVPGYRHW